MVPSMAGTKDESFTLDDLVQELCMALVGYTGDVFVDSADQVHSAEVLSPSNCTVQLAQDIVLADTVSRDQLNQLVQLGFHYKQIKRFMLQEQQATGCQRSMYRQALCNGLEEVLAVYEDEVVLLQDQLLQDGTDRGLPGIIYQLADLQRLLPQVHSLVFELRRRNPFTLDQDQAATLRQAQSSRDSSGGHSSAGYSSGGSLSDDSLVAMPEGWGVRLLAYLHARRLNGEPLLQACLQRLLWHVNQILFNQLTMWMVHGQLIDNGEEFFIRPRADTAKEGSRGVDAAADDTQPQQDTRSTGSGGNGGLDMLQMSEEDTYRDFHSAFEVALAELPPGITPHTATSVEFVGRAVRLLRSPPASAKLRQMQDSCSSYAQQQQQGPLQGAQTVPQQLLPYGDAIAYAAALRVLQQQSVYSQAALERTVEAIRADVASRLWQLVVVQSGLMQHLAALKDYMLLAKGDFYQCFLVDAARLLAHAPQQPGKNTTSTAAATRDIAVPWQSAALKSTAAEDPHFKLFRLVFKGQPEDSQQQENKAAAAAASGSRSGSQASGVQQDTKLPDYDGWDNLWLEAHLPWPLGVLVTPEDLQRYNALFKLLWKLKRVQLALESAWQEIGRLCGRQGSLTQPGDIGRLLLLRQHIGHLIANLQIYLQLDVIETNYATLQDKVAAAQDFAEVAHAHKRFLHAIMMQSFMSHKTMVQQLGCVFVQARELCSVVKGAREGGIDWDRVKAIEKDFIGTVRSLYVNLRSKSLQAHDKAPYLSQLYLRLDFNNFIQGLGLCQYVTTSGHHRQASTPYRLQQKEQQRQQQQQQRPA